MPGGYYNPGYSSSSSWNTHWTSPGEVIRTKSKVVNSAADPAKNSNVALNNSNKITDWDTDKNSIPDNIQSERIAANPLLDPISGILNNPSDVFSKNPPRIGETNSDYLLRVTGNPGFMRNEDVWNGTAFVKPEEFKGASAATSGSQQTNIPGLIDYGQDWAGNVAKSEEMYKDLDKKESLLYYPPEDPSQYGYMIDPATGEVVKNPKGTDVDQRGLVWSGKYDDKKTTVDESLVWSNPISAEEYDKNPSKYNYDESYIFTNPDGTQSSVRGKGSEFSPWNTKHEEALNARVEAAEQQASYIANIPKDVRAKKYKEINKQYGSDILDANGNFTKYYESYFSLEENPVMDYDFIQKQFGGPISGVEPDEYGNLQKFIYGGDEDIPISPIVAYDNNDIQSKNVDDPFMFRNGGLYKFQGPQNSQVNSSNSGIKADSPAPGWTWDEWNALPEATRNKFSQTLETQRNQSQTQTRTQTQGGYNAQNYGYGYPTAPSPMRQIFDMFNPIKKDFTWLSQRDYPRTADGQIYNPQRQGQNQGQGQGTTTQDQTQGQTNPAKAGYMYDYKYEKGPWWSGKKTLTVSGKWVDPNNPNAGAAQPGSGNTQNNVSTNTTTNNATANNTPEGWKGYPYVLPGTETQTPTPDVSRASSTTPTPDVSRASSTTPTPDVSRASSTTPTQQGAFPPGDPRGEYMKSQLTLPPKAPAPPEPMPAGFPANTSGPRLTEEDQMAYGGYVPNYMAYGGYMPSYQGGGTNAGSGPFDPNVSGIAGGGIGPCTEQQVLNAAPGDPCYNEGYSKGKGTPQDFSVQYDINDAKTLDLKATSRLKNLAGFGLRANAGRKEMNYNQDYLADNTTSDNREAANELDYTGGYSGLNQRIMSKSGAGATGFNRVVGEAAFVKRGGELKYQRGGVYDLTQEEIGQILAAGGQIKFIK
jgi:hypothetical protein